MHDFWIQLFDRNAFMPHIHCYLSAPGLVRLHVFTDLAIGLAYVAISCALGALFWRSRRELPFPWIFLGFGIFILACAGTHFMEVVTLWVPLYWISGVIKLITAIASVSTAVLLFFLIPKVLAMVVASQLAEQRKVEAEAAVAALETARRERRAMEIAASRQELAKRSAQLEAANQQLNVVVRRLSEQASLLDVAHDAIVVRDLEGVISFWNRGAQTTYGWSKEEALQQTVHGLLTTTFPAALTTIQQTLLREGQWEGELTQRKRDGSQVIVASRWVLQPKGETSGATVLEINNDITARKDTEKLAMQRSAQLEAANEELEEFASVASHDLKAPLRVIDNASKWLEEDLDAHLSEDTRAHLALMRTRILRMDKLLDDLLEYARIGRATDGRYSEMISGDVLIQEVLALLAPGELRLTVKPGFDGIRVRRMPLQHILLNLISNAIKHHHKKNGNIEVTVEDTGENFAFAVKDDGPGIPAKFHDQIFKMFQTLKPRDKVEGSGMGLALVRKSLDVFGGALELESCEGRGSTFRFTWPKQQRLV